LTVSGTTTSINTETLTLDDNIIILNNNATGDPSENAGIEVERGSSTNVALRWNESSDKWEFTNDGTTYADIQASITAGSGLNKAANTISIASANSNRIVINANDIDLATVAQSNTVGSPGISFVQSQLIDSYGRISGTTSADIRTASTSVTGIASFNPSTFQITSGQVSIAASGITNSQLANSNVIINGTTIQLGASETITANAQTLSGTTLAPNVLNSILTSVATITSGTWQGSAVGVAYGGTGSTTASGAINTLLPSQTNNEGKFLTSASGLATWSIIIFENINDVVFTSKINGDFLRYDSTLSKWKNATATIDDLSDVTITSAASSQFLKWNGTAWVNDAIDLGTDTTGNYMSDLTAGTGITITHTPAEGSNATIAVTPNTYQPLDSELTAIAGLTSENNKLPYFTGSGTAAVTDITSTARSLIDDASISEMRATLDLEIGIDVQAYDPDLAALAGLTDVITFTEGVGELPYFTAAGTAALTDITTAARSILDDTSTSAIRTTLGVGTSDSPTFAGATLDAVQVGITAAGEIDTTSGNLTIDSAGGTVTVDDNLTVTGNLTVSGTTTTVNTETVTINDNIIVLNNNSASEPTENAGIEVERGDVTNVALRWNESTDKWQFTNDGSTYQNISGGNYVSDVTAGTGVTVTHTPSEGSSATIAIGQSVATNANPTFAGATLDAVQVGITAAGEIDTTSGNLTIDSAGGTVTVDDVLTVNGNINTSNQIRITGTTATSIPNVNGQQEAFLTVRASAASYDDGNGPSLAIIRGSNNTGLTISQYGSFALTNGGFISGYTGDGGGGTVEIRSTSGATHKGLMVTAGNSPASGNKIQTWQSHDQTINSFVKPDGSFSIRNVQVGLTAAGEIDTSSGNLTIDSAGGTVTVDDNLTVTGNLTVSGTTTTVNTETVTINDNIIVLNNNSASEPTENAGIEVERGDVTNVALRWNESSDRWELTNDGTTYANIVTSSSTDTLTSKTLTSPVINTSITTGSSSVDLFTSTATTVNFANAATTFHIAGAATAINIANTATGAQVLNLGSASTGESTYNIGTGATGASTTKILNLGTNGAVSSTTNINIGSANGGTITLNSPTVTISGNLTVSGTTTTINTATLNIADNQIVLNSDVTGAPTENAGVTVERGTSTDVDIRWNETSDLWEITEDGTNYDLLSSRTLFNQQTASYTLIRSDKNKIVEMSATSGLTLTVPADNTVDYPVGSEVRILQTNTGQVTLAGAVGVTVNATPGLKLRAQWSSATLVKRAANTWVALGDLAA